MRMLKRGTRTARITIALGLASGVALIGGGSALAADTIVGADPGGLNSYSAATYNMDQGEQVQFQNMGPSNEHDVWSRLNGPDGKKLFISPTIRPGNSTTVKGTEYLTTGTYAFFCNVHPFEMSANLIVTGNGTPVPRPQIDVTILGKSIDKAVKKGRLSARLQAVTTSNDVELELKLGKKVIGSKSNVDMAASTSKILAVPLTKAGKAKLAKKKKAKVKLTGSVPFGSPDTAKKKLT
jgi:plastocyanin